ncbi:MAG: zinc ABC transporter substrate-binding protein [Pseudorhodobacter sp.]
MRHILLPFTAGCLLSSPVIAEVPRVVTDIPPVHSLVAMVMGDLGEPYLVMDRGGNAHSVQLRPSQARHLAEADLAIWMGEGMSPWMGRALAGVSTARPLELPTIEDTYLRAFSEPGGHDDHDDHDDTHEGHDHAADNHADEDDDGDHDHFGQDPHSWLDPANAILWLPAIARDLGDLDSENAEKYMENARAAAERLADLDDELAVELEPVMAMPFVLSHDALGYFSDHYGLTFAGAVRLGDATAPGAARLVQIRAELEAGGVICAFSEIGHDPEPIVQLVDGTNVRMGGELDPAGVSFTPGADLYPELLRKIAGVLTTCLKEG